MVTSFDSMVNKLISIGLILFQALCLNAAEQSIKVGPAKKKMRLHLVDSVSASTAKKMNLDDVPLQGTPLFTSDDIVAYDRSSHSFTLTNEALEKVCRIDVPMWGRPFVVSVDDRRVYLGVFWSILSSYIWDGISITRPWEQGQNLEIGLTLWPPREVKQDPRNDPEILEVMRSRFTESTSSDKKVCLYLLESTLTAYDLDSVSITNLVLEAQPLFTSDDVIRYGTNSHSFLLTEEAYRRVRAVHVPVEGKPFVVVAGDRRVYFGAFWSPVSSHVWRGITIMDPWETEPIVLQILPQSPLTNDLRNDPEILRIMEARNKAIQNGK